MNVEGLGDERRGTISQICHLVSEVQDFRPEQFKRMVDSFEKEDPTTYQILKEAIVQADDNYSQYLNAKIIGTPSRFSSIGRPSEMEEGSVLFKAMSELRERLRDEKEYRRNFLGPKIQQVSSLYDVRLRKVQKQEIRRQKDEARARAKLERRGSRSFGLGF